MAGLRVAMLVGIGARQANLSTSITRGQPVCLGMHRGGLGVAVCLVSIDRALWKEEGVIVVAVLQVRV